MPLKKLEELTSFHRSLVEKRYWAYWLAHHAEINQLMRGVDAQFPCYSKPVEPEGALLFDCSRWDGHHWAWYFDLYILNKSRVR